MFNVTIPSAALISIQLQIANTMRVSVPQPPQMEVSAPPPPPLKCRWVPPPENVLSSFEEQDILSSENIGVSQRWSLYFLWWLCIYPSRQTRQDEIWTFKLNLTLKVKVSGSQVHLDDILCDDCNLMYSANVNWNICMVNKFSLNIILWVSISIQ